MKSEWKKIKLGDVCNIRSSKRIFAREYCSQGIPFYRGKEIIEKHKGHTVSTELFITEDRYMEIMEKNDVPRVGDILLTSVGTLGIPWLVDEDRFYFKDGNLTWLRVKRGLDNRYLYLWLCSPEAKYQIEMNCIGSTQKAITIETLNKFEMLIPNIEMQRKIVNLLFAIIKKIELNRKINDNLLQQAQAVFDSYYDVATIQHPFTSMFHVLGGCILQGLLAEFRTSYRIYMTATPEEVKPIIALEEFNLRERHLADAENSQNLSALGQSAKIIEYKFKADYKSRIQLHFFHNESSKKKAESEWIDIIETIRHDTSPDKWLLFVSRKEIGQEIQKELGSSIAEYIDASYREIKRKEIMDMTRREMFEAKVLITTSFLYNGINFHDRKLKNIVMDYTNRTSIIQALGRKRLDNGEKVKVYIKACSRKELETYRDSTQNQYGLTQEFRANPSQFLTSKWGQLTQGQMKMFAPAEYDPNWIENAIQNELVTAKSRIYNMQKVTRGETSADEFRRLSEYINYLCNLLNSFEKSYKMVDKMV